MSAEASEDRLAAAVQRLQAEVDGLRRAQRTRAVIDQAKGLLVERLRCSPEEAFTHLSHVSQQSNMKVVEVAAGLLGIAAPIPAPLPAPADETGSRPQRYTGPSPAVRGVDPETPALAAVLPEVATARYHLACAAMSAVEDVRTLAEAVWAQGLRHLGVSAVLLGVLEPDGAVRLLSTHGLPRSLTSSWERVPGTLNVAFLQAVANGRALWLTRAQAAERGYQLLGEGDLRACVPLHSRGRVFGVASVIWREDCRPDAIVRAYVGVLAEACGRRMSQLLQATNGRPIASPSAHWVDAVLEALPGSYALLSAVRDAAGDIVDWRFDRCSPEAADASGRTADDISGRRLLDLYPHAISSGVLDGYAHALRTGEPFVLEPTPLLLSSHRHQLPVVMSVRAGRFGDGLLVHWRYHDAERQIVSRMERVERLGGAGWAEWDMITGTATWSASAYEILLRDPQLGPLKLNKLDRAVSPEDAGDLRAALRSLTQDKAPVDIVVRAHRPGRSRRVRLLADPVVDRLGRLVAVHAALRALSDAAPIQETS